MAKQKHILILTETRGGKGHIMPARAIEDALHHLYPQKHRVSIVNMGDETKFALEDTLHFLYIYTSKYIPGVLSTYKLSDTAAFMKSINNAFYKLKRKEILELYEKFQPDLVLSNYPVWEYAFYKVLRKHYPGVPFVNLNTDSHYPHYARSHCVESISQDDGRCRLRICIYGSQFACHSSKAGIRFGICRRHFYQPYPRSFGLSQKYVGVP